jgi:hypothetical protein
MDLSSAGPSPAGEFAPELRPGYPCLGAGPFSYVCSERSPNKSLARFFVSAALGLFISRENKQDAQQANQSNFHHLQLSSLSWLYWSGSGNWQ